VKYTTESMDALRRRGDPLADRTVDELFAQGEVAKLNTLMRSFSRSGAGLPDGLPPAAREYLEATRLPPDWVDWDIIERARLFFVDNNVHISTALAFSAMPAGYACRPLSRLLSATHSMEYPSRRMAETGQFTVYLMAPGAFDAGSRLIPAVQKVRLLHASIRHHLRRESTWDEAAWGVPICQEDLLGALMGFSINVLDSLQRLGIHVSQDGAEAYYYAWRVVGAMLGCDQAAAPVDLDAARVFGDLYMIRHLGPSDEAVRLTRHLIELYEDVVPGTLLDPIVPAMIRYLVGDTIADWLDVPRSTWDTIAKVVPVFLGILEQIEDSGPVGRWLLDRAGSLATNLELTSLTSGRVMHYAIPEALKREYGQPPGSRTKRWTPPPAFVPYLPVIAGAPAAPRSAHESAPAGGRHPPRRGSGDRRPA
jgi:hypothetical protein